ncbi:MAG: GTP cyclohydrolase I, partial [Rhabdochlamydiaceae bacterium]
MAVDKPEVSKLVASLIEAMGQNLNDEGLRDTPSRVAESLEELTSGYSMDPKKILEVE